MSDEIPEKPRRRSEKTRALIKARALERGAQRSGDVATNVRTAMEAIKSEMAANGGVYPLNGGAVSIMEVARRAGIHFTTLYKKQKALGEEVKQWVEELKDQETVGRGPVKKSLNQRIEDWEKAFNSLSQSHRDTELELQEVESQLALARIENEKLKDEIEALKKLLASAGHEKVIPIRKKGE